MLKLLKLRWISKHTASARMFTMVRDVNVINIGREVQQYSTNIGILFYLRGTATHC